MHAHHLLLALLPPSCQRSVDFGSGDSVGQDKAAVHHRETLLKLQLHSETVVFTQRQLGRTQTTGEDKDKRENSLVLSKKHFLS